MLGTIYDCIGNLLGEDKPPQVKEEEIEEPDEFAPGFLFDASASWVLLVRRLLIPRNERTSGGPVFNCKCGNAKHNHSAAGGSSCSTAKKEKGFSFFSCK